jgi:xylan 1,4-beta-xylosidase
MSGDSRLDRNVRLEVDGVDPAIVYDATISRIDVNHSNIAAACPTDTIWPDEQLWSRLRAADALATQPIAPTEPASTVTALRFDYSLPMPGVARIRLRPVRSTPGTPQQRSSDQPD